MNSGDERLLRVSVATYNRVTFPHPQTGTLILALERKATVINDRGDKVQVRAQPFGGAVRIVNPLPLQQRIGGIRFDSEASKREQDFRILIPPAKWEFVKQYCLRQLENRNDRELESLPDRELMEEFEETLDVHLKPNQYTIRPEGFVIEDNPVPTDNLDARGQRTVRLYRIFEVDIVDGVLCRTMLDASQRSSNQEVAACALGDKESGGLGRVNSVLTLPLDRVIESYLALPPEMRYRKIVVGDHELDESVLAILRGVNVPQYKRL